MPTVSRSGWFSWTQTRRAWRTNLLVAKAQATAPAGSGEGELWTSVFKRLVVWTAKRHRMNPADAEETVQEAIRQFLAGGGQADPAYPRALVDALGSRVNGIAVNRRRKKADRFVNPTRDGSIPEPDEHPDTEQRLADAQFAHRAISALLGRLDGDELAMSVLLAWGDGVDGASDQASSLGRNVREVYNARRRLKAHVEVLLAQMEDI